MTNTHRSLALAGLAALTLSAATTVPALSSATAPEPDVTLTYKLAGKDAESTRINEGRRGESVGDRDISAVTLRSNGEVAGRLQGECVVLDNTYEGHLCHLVLIVDGGQITATAGGLRKRVGDIPPTGDVFAVTGGTGDYQGVGGQIQVDDGRTLTVNLNLHS